MATLTSNYSFILPAVNDPIDQDIWGGQLNDNWASIDLLLKRATDSDVQSPETADFSVDATSGNLVIPVDASAGAVNVSVASAATLGNGFTTTILGTDTTNAITITPDGLETINGQASLTISSDYDGVIIISDGTNLLALVVAVLDISSQPSEAVTAADEFVFSDVSDSNNNKKDTIQGIIDLVPTPIKQIVNVPNSTAISSASNIPQDGTRPQITEGVEVFSDLFEPTDAASTIIIEVDISSYIAAPFNYGTVALFDGGTDAIAAAITGGGVSSGASNGMSARFVVPATDTVARTYSIRAGMVSGTLYINRSAGSATPFGATPVQSNMTITEI